MPGCENANSGYLSWLEHGVRARTAYCVNRLCELVTLRCRYGFGMRNYRGICKGLIEDTYLYPSVWNIVNFFYVGAMLAVRLFRPRIADFPERSPHPGAAVPDLCLNHTMKQFSCQQQRTRYVKKSSRRSTQSNHSRAPAIVPTLPRRNGFPGCSSVQHRR